MAILKKLNEIRQSLEEISQAIKDNLDTRIDFEFKQAEYIAEFGEIMEMPSLKEINDEISKFSDKIGEGEGELVTLLTKFQNKIEELRIIAGT